MDIDSLRREYEQKNKGYERLKEEIVFILEKEFQEQKIPIHEITGRIKSFDSLVDKARRQESADPFKTVLDICGVRVICLFLSDLLHIGEIIEAKFSIHAKDDKIYTKPEEAFGYLSVHYIGGLPDSFSGPRYDDLNELKFEIQLRTIAMHAWATISHYLDYKSPLAIPSALRKDFNALSALFYVADTHFEIFARSSQEAKELAKQKAEGLLEIGKEEINLDTLGAYLRKKYPDREHGDPGDISKLVEELQASCYTRIEQLEVALQRTGAAFAAYENENPPVEDPHFMDIGVVRTSLAIADDGDIDRRKVPPKKQMGDKYERYRHLVRNPK